MDVVKSIFLHESDLVVTPKHKMHWRGSG